MTCTTGFYKTETGCLSCPKECTDCQFNPDTKSVFCFACLNDFDYFLNTKGVCLKTLCPSGMIFNPLSSTGCDKCPDKCNSCERTAAGGLSCIQCVTGFKPDAAGVCVFDSASCPAKTTSVGTYCKSCPEPCASCEFVDATKTLKCKTCVDGFVPDSDNVFCVKSCNPDQYFGPDSFGLLECQKCPMGCTACRLNSTINKAICTGCDTAKGFAIN